MNGMNEIHGYNYQDHMESNTISNNIPQDNVESSTICHIIPRDNVESRTRCHIIPPHDVKSELIYSLLTTSGPLGIFIAAYFGAIDFVFRQSIVLFILTWITYILLFLMFTSVIWATLAAFFRWTYAWRAFFIHLIILVAFIAVSMIAKWTGFRAILLQDVSKQ
jgi:hypothetical protein